MTTKIYWLSFCDESKAAGEKFLGVCIVEAPDTIAAVKLAHEKHCNPGGEVMAVGIEITPAELERAKPFMYRVLDRDECFAFDATMRDDGEPGSVHELLWLLRALFRARRKDGRAASFEQQPQPQQPTPNPGFTPTPTWRYNPRR